MVATRAFSADIAEMVRILAQRGYLVIPPQDRPALVLPGLVLDPVGRLVRLPTAPPRRLGLRSFDILYVLAAVWPRRLAARALIVGVYGAHDFYSRDTFRSTACCIRLALPGLLGSTTIPTGLPVGGRRGTRGGTGGVDGAYWLRLGEDKDATA